MTVGRSGRALVVGFDLDMTLVDSRLGIVECMQAVLRSRGRVIGEDDLWPLIGAPLEANLTRFLPPDQVASAAGEYREVYLRRAVQMTTAMSGAAELLNRIHADGGRVLVVSAKSPTAVHAVLAHVGLGADVVVGGVFGPDKARPLRKNAAQVFVGDHQGDMRAARAADTYAVGVTTGPHSAAMLREAGADAVVPDLVAMSERLGEFEQAVATG